MNLKMKKVWKSLLLPLVIAVLLFPMQVFAAEFAAEYQCEAELPVTVQVGGNNVPTGVDFTVTIEAEDEAPLPETTSLTVRDGGTVEFGPIAYTKPGDYVYTIRQTKGSAKYFIYDETVYTVTVRVTNADASADAGLEADVWAVKDGGKDKVMNIAFANTYDPPVPTATPTDEHPEIAQAIKDGTWGVDDPAPTKVTARLPQTGDTSNPVLWAAVMAVALAALAGVVIVRRRGNKD